MVFQVSRTPAASKSLDIVTELEAFFWVSNKGSTVALLPHLHGVWFQQSSQSYPKLGGSSSDHRLII